MTQKEQEIDYLQQKDIDLICALRHKPILENGPRSTHHAVHGN